MPLQAKGVIIRESKAPDWIRTLYTGEYRPNPDWGRGLISREEGGVDRFGYRMWHEKGCGTEKAKSIDSQNWAETPTVIAGWLRDYEITAHGAPQRHNPMEYWGLIHKLSGVAVTRLRAKVAMAKFEFAESEDWQAYCWIWMKQCELSEAATPDWFRRQLQLYKNTRVDLGRIYLDNPEENAVVRDWLKRKGIAAG